MLRPALHYRREAFNDGLRAAGFDVVEQLPKPQPGDALLIWNRYAGFHEVAHAFERAGALVLVCENGWLGKAWRGGEWFSLCRDHHAGAGRWAIGGPQRWDCWGVEMAPYRTDGDEAVIFGQRGIGEPGIASPHNWAEATRHRIGGRIRPHPGNAAPAVPLADDLRRARECATWNSAAGLHALLLGVPVWHAFPQWIGAGASRPLAEWGKADPMRHDGARLEMFRRLAWAMWTLDEIRTGGPIRRLTA